LGKILLFGYFLLEHFLPNKQVQNIVCSTYFNIKSSWVQVFWTFNLSFNFLASILATFQNIGQIFAQFSGHSGHNCGPTLNFSLFFSSMVSKGKQFFKTFFF
jgi:hypothetical protein